MIYFIKVTINFGKAKPVEYPSEGST